MFLDTNKLYNIFRIKNEHTVYIASIFTGIFTGAVTWFFVFLMEQGHHYLEHYFPSYSNPDLFGADGTFNFHYGYWAFIFLPALGGLLTGIISHNLSHETSGSGMDSLIGSFHQMEGKLKGRIAFYKVFTSVFTITSGGSAGKEGPIAQIGGSIGSKINDLLGGGPKARRTLLLAGAAGGLGAVFHAPLGGAMTAVEMIYKEDIESDALLPAIISSMSSYLLYSALAGFEPVYSPGGVVPIQPYSSYLFYILLGFIAYWTGHFFIHVYNSVRDAFEKLPVNNMIKPAIGGLMVGAMGYFFPFILGSGESFVQRIMELNTHPETLQSLTQMGTIIIIIIFLKIVATALTIGSGGSGGMFGPSLYIGGLVGFLVGLLARYVLVGTPISLSSFMLVGMGAIYSGIARAPIAAMIMICEMIGSYVLLPPLMIGSIITLVLAHNIAIYRTQLHNRFKSPAHSYDLDIMRKITISQFTAFLRNHAVVPKNTSIRKLKTLGKKLQASDFIITSDKGDYFGMISLKKNHDFSKIKAKRPVRSIADVAEKIPSVTIDNTLGDALNIILEYEVDKVAITNETKLLGYFRFKDILNFYYQNMSRQEKHPKANK